jgi:hypothetical protein
MWRCSPPFDDTAYCGALRKPEPQSSIDPFAPRSLHEAAIIADD